LTSPGINVSFYIRPGMNLKIDTGGNQETVEVDTVDLAKKQITIKKHANGVYFQKTHTGRFPYYTPLASSLVPSPPTAAPLGGNPPIGALGVMQGPVGTGGYSSIYGNPGPQEGLFDVRQNSLVVPYFSIIQ
jgi:hypothetical protein